MKKTTILIAVLALGLIGNQFYRKSHLYKPLNSKEVPKMKSVGTSTDAGTANDRFTCDGRTYCSEMTSCEEAIFFLKNCPGVKMDGDNGGIPCEKQWCQ